MNWIFYGTIYDLSDNYTVTVNETVTSGDPFNGLIQNDTSYIDAKIEFGSVDTPCQHIVSSETELTDDDFATTINMTITWSGYIENTTCDFYITASNGSTYMPILKQKTYLFQ